jgi:hypothetical protein
MEMKENDGNLMFYYGKGRELVLKEKTISSYIEDLRERGKQLGSDEIRQLRLGYRNAMQEIVRKEVPGRFP